MKKVFDQTVRDLKRGVNKKVLKVPGIEQKVLDATSNEPWGPHGTLLADIAQATRNYHEYQMIMAVIWKRINDTGKNWRHVYKALTVLEYLLAHGSERVIEDIRERGYQISTLADFQYIDSGGRDQGSNVRKKSQGLVALVNDKERIIEVREKAAANRDKFRSAAAGGMYKPGSYSSSGGYGDRYDYDHYEGRYGGRDDDQNGYDYGREREYGYRDDDRYGRNGDSYGRDGDRYGRDYEDCYNGDGCRDDDYRGRSKSVDSFQYGTSRNSDRNRAFDDDGQASSRQLERKNSEQNIGAPPSYEEALSGSRSPIPSERGGEASAASVPKFSSPPPALRAVSPPHAPSTSSPPGASSASSPNASQGSNLFDNTASGNYEVLVSDEFDPRGTVPAMATMSSSAAPPTTNSAEVDLLGSLSDVFSPNPLAIVPAISATTTPEADAFADAGSVPTFSTQAAPTVMNQTFEDPFGDSPFKAVPSTDATTSQQETSASASSVHPSVNQNADIPQPVAPNAEAATSFGYTFYGVAYSAPSVSNVQSPSANSQFLPQELLTSQPHTDILADILPPMGASPTVASQGSFSAPTGQPPQPSSNIYGGFYPQPGSMILQPGSMTQVASTLAPQTSSGSVSQFGGGNFNPQATSTAPFPSYMAPQSPAGPAGQFNGGNFLSHQSSAVPAASQVAHQTPASPSTQQNGDLLNNILPQAGQNPPIASQSSLPSSIGALAIVSQSQPPKDKFEPKSAVWADTLSRGLVNLNISGPKINPLADIGVDFDAINRKEKRMEKQPLQTAVTSTVTMGKAMGAGSGLGRAGAGALCAPPNPMMGSSMAMGMGGGQGMGIGMGGGPGMGVGMGGGPGMGMGGYGGVNQPMGMGMAMGMTAGNMGMGQGGQMQSHSGMPPGSTMPGGYRPMMGIGGYSQQPYGGGCR